MYDNQLNILQWSKLLAETICLTFVWIQIDSFQLIDRFLELALASFSSKKNLTISLK